jgi:hypothetical protein
MRKRWKKWKKEDREFSTKINIENQLEENHDTISMLAIDKRSDGYAELVLQAAWRLNCTAGWETRL